MTARRIIPILLILATTLATFSTVIRNEFVLWDDPETISQNPHLNPPSWEGVAYYWTHGDPGLFAPLTYMMWSALAGISRGPAIFYGYNLALHLAASLTAFALLRNIFDGRDAAATIGALLFALHPLQVETVAWATAGKDLLASVLSLLAILQYLRFARDRSIARYVAATAFFILALLAKPLAVATPILMAALDWLVVGRDPNRVARSVWPMLIIAVPFVVLAAHFQVPQAQLPVLPWWSRILVAGDAVTFYLTKLFVPHPLTIDYGRTPVSVLQRGSIEWLACVPPLALLGLMLWTRRRAPIVCAGIAIFLVGLLPVLGIVPFMFQIHSTVADHYLYLPMLGIAMIAGFAVSRYSTNFVYAGSGLLILLLMMLSMHQTRYWQHSVTLFAHAADITPGIASVQGNYGRALATAGKLDEAIPHFESAVRLSPDSRTAQMLLAQAYVYSSHFEQAVAPAGRAIELAQQQGETDTAWEHFLLGKALAGLGRLDDAERELALAFRIDPRDLRIRAELERVRQQRSQK